MDTINISLPSQLKGQADTLIRQGYFASFSDLVRTALRTIIAGTYYDRLTQQTVQDHRVGKTKVLRTKKDIDAFIDTSMS